MNPRDDLSAFRIITLLLLALVVPPVIWRICFDLLNYPGVARTLRQYGPLFDVVGRCGLLVSVGVGFSFIARIAPYRSLGRSERLLLIGSGILYVTCYAYILILVSIGWGGGI